MRITDRIDGEDDAFRDVILGYDDPAEYERQTCYFGEVIGRDIRADFIQLAYAGGYDHNYVLDTRHGVMRLAAQALCEESGIAMDFSTDCMGMQFYSGNFVERHAGKEGVFYDFRHGFCLEPQYYPNAVNEERFASPLLHPGETYQAHTKIKFYQK